MSSAAPPVVVTVERLHAAITLPEAVAAVAEAFRATAGGGAGCVQPLPLTLATRDGEVHVKAAQLPGADVLVVKLATGYPGGPARGLPSGDGLIAVLNCDTGQLRAVLLDRGWLTDVRTAAAATVAVRALAVTRRRLAVLGTGVQADLIVRTMAAVDLLPASVALWGRTPERAARLLDRLRRALPKHAAAITTATTAPQAVDGADVVVTVTAARTPVLYGAWLAADAVVVAVGADSVGKRECDAVVLTRAEAVITDRTSDCARLGELQHALGEQSLRAPVLVLGDLLTGLTAPPTSGVRVCDLVGLGIQDAAIASLALRNITHGTD